MGNREASDDPAGVSGAPGYFRIVPHIEARGHAFVPLVSASYGRREGNLEEGSSLQPKTMLGEGHSCEPSANNTPSTSGMSVSPDKGI